MYFIFGYILRNAYEFVHRYSICRSRTEVCKITAFSNESGPELNNDSIVQYLGEQFGLEFE